MSVISFMEKKCYYSSNFDWRESGFFTLSLAAKELEAS